MGRSARYSWRCGGRSRGCVASHGVVGRSAARTTTSALRTQPPQKAASGRQNAQHRNKSMTAGPSGCLQGPKGREQRALWRCTSVAVAAARRCRMLQSATTIVPAGPTAGVPTIVSSLKWSAAILAPSTGALWKGVRWLPCWQQRSASDNVVAAWSADRCCTHSVEFRRSELGGDGVRVVEDIEVVGLGAEGGVVVVVPASQFLPSDGPRPGGGGGAGAGPGAAGRAEGQAHQPAGVKASIRAGSQGQLGCRRSADTCG